MRAKAIARGLLSRVPGFEAVYAKWRGGGGTRSPRYCYSVWLRHLVMAHQHGLSTAPRIVAELGPGDSVGVGLAALLTGSEQYLALDVVAYANVKRNLEILDSLIDLLKRRAPIPHESDLREVQPCLPSWEFPAHILTRDRLAAALAPARLDWIRRATREIGEGHLEKPPALSYQTSWSDADRIIAGSVDLIFSQAVLEHVEDLPRTYRAMHAWLKPGGYMSHQVDLRSHGWTQQWNGHWTLSDREWRLAQGRRAYSLNGEPCSSHLALVNELDFAVVCVERMIDEAGVDRSSLPARYRSIPDDDLRTAGVFFQARKRGEWS